MLKSVVFVVLVLPRGMRVLKCNWVPRLYLCFVCALLRCLSYRCVKLDISFNLRKFVRKVNCVFAKFKGRVNEIALLYLIDLYRKPLLVCGFNVFIGTIDKCERVSWAWNSAF